VYIEDKESPSSVIPLFHIGIRPQTYPAVILNIPYSFSCLPVYNLKNKKSNIAYTHYTTAELLMRALQGTNAYAAWCKKT
jgi:hypothetical protein